jgi:hypothetical protein
MNIQGLLRTFRAYEIHLSNLSHQNAKAEGLVKMLLGKDIMCFILFLNVINFNFLLLSDLNLKFDFA